MVAGSSTISPVDIAGLVVWLRADLGITLVSGKVSAWADQSGGGHNLSQSTADDRPVYNASDSNFNGQSTVTWDGVHDQMRFSSVPTFGDSEGELFQVYKRETHPPATDTEAGGWRLTGGGQVFYPAKEGDIWDLTFSTVRSNCGTPVVTMTNAHVYDCYADNSNWTLELNGTQQFTKSNTFRGWDDAQPDLGTSNGWGRFFEGEQAEFIGYDRVLTAGERSQVLDYLNERYGIA